MRRSLLSSDFITVLTLMFALSKFVRAQTSTPEPSPAPLVRPIDTAFDVQPNSIAGGCSPAQKDALSTPFDERIQMKNIISIATGEMSSDAESPSTGWMFNYLFAIPSTQENQDYGDARDDTQVDDLMSIWSLMDLIDRHTAGKFLVRNTHGMEGKTRLYYNQDWMKRTDYAIDPRTDQAIRPRRPLNEHWYDKVTKIAFRKQTVPPLIHGSMTICGAENLAVTHLYFNTITFCGLLWDGTVRPTLTSWNPSHQLILLDSYQSFSKVFFHEYTHLVGRTDLSDMLMVNVESADRGRESIGFYPCTDLASSRGAQVALKNADSYAVLGVALFLSNCDWRDGSCQIVAYWEGICEKERNED